MKKEGIIIYFKFAEWYSIIIIETDIQFKRKSVFQPSLQEHTMSTNRGHPSKFIRSRKVLYLGTPAALNQCITISLR